MRRRAVLRALEIHHVQLLRAGRFELRGERSRIVGIDLHPAVIALIEPDRLLFIQIDRRKDQHGFHSSLQNARRMASPASPLFSGWNWHPITFSRAAAAVSARP